MSVDSVKVVLCYPTHVDLKNRIGKIDWDNGLIGLSDGIYPKKTSNYQFDAEDIARIKGLRLFKSKYFALLDVNGRKTIALNTDKSIEPKRNFKLDELVTSTYWKNKAIQKRDMLLVLLAFLAGSFNPFILKWLALMFNRGVPW